MKRVYRVEITPKAVLMLALMAIFLLVLWKLREIIILVFVAFAIASMLSPVIDYLYLKKIPKNLSIAIIYITFFTLLILTIALIYKPFLQQMEDFIAALPNLLSNFLNILVEKVPILKERLNWETIKDSMNQAISKDLTISTISTPLISGIKGAVGVVGSIFGFLVKFFSIIILSVYFIRFKESSKKVVLRFVPIRHKNLFIKFIDKVEKQLGAWLRAQLFLMLIIGVLGWLGFEIVNIRFAIPLGILAGILEVLPNIGPVITWIIAVSIAIGAQVPLWKVIFVAVWFILTQQFENYLIVPKLMQKSVGLNPVITIVAILSFSKIFGFFGALLAVPATAVGQIVFVYYMEYRKSKTTSKP